MQMVIIDDEQAIVTALEREIRIGYPEGDFEVMPFTDPVRGLEHIANNKNGVFLVISDMRMPGMDGADLLKKIRETNPDVQSVLLTGYSDIEDIRRAVSTSIMSFLLKPWNQGELFAEIDKARKIWNIRSEHAALKAELDMQLETAGEFQRLLFKSNTTNIAGAKIDICSKPLSAMKCGGDYFDVIAMHDESFTILLGDASGHGLRSAFVTIMIKTLVQNMRLRAAPCLGNPAELLSALNRELCRLLANTPGMFAAMNAITFRPQTGEVLYSNAGLPPLFHVTGTEVRTEVLDGTVLGFNPKASYSRVSFQTSPGDRIVILTDGIFEDVKNQLKPGWENIARKLKSMRELEAESIQENFRTLIPGEKFSDDSTIITIDIGTD